MHTVIHKLLPGEPDSSIIEAAAGILRNGGVVAFPTETVYGLGADALNPEAIKKVFIAKGRPADNPLIVHIAALEQVEELGKEVSSTAFLLCKTFMPGPLTIVIKHSNIVPSIVTAGLNTVALRMPNHPVPLALVKALGRGMVGPSANLSGKPSPTTAQHVFDDLDGAIEMILDAGPTHIGVESTVIDTTSEPPTILRPGGITREELERVIGPVRVSSEIHELRRSPGTRHRHYAPRGKVILIKPNDVEVFQRVWNDARNRWKKARALVYSPAMLALPDARLFDVLPSTIEGYSRQIFSALRRLDTEEASVIIIEGVEERGLGIAVMDRLRRAAEATSDLSGEKEE